jgi:hypothetical protein
MSALADHYYKKARLCEHLANHWRELGRVAVALTYTRSAEHWRKQARELRNATL